MKFIEYFSNLAMPLMIIIIILYGILERKKLVDIFLEGAKDGIKIIYNIFPTLVGLFVAIGAIRSSGIIDVVVKFLNPLLNIVNFPTEILPLALIRPISGSASVAVATDIMKNFGVDSNIELFIFFKFPDKIAYIIDIIKNDGHNIFNIEITYIILLVFFLFITY